MIYSLTDTEHDLVYITETSQEHSCDMHGDTNTKLQVRNIGKPMPKQDAMIIVNWLNTNVHSIEIAENFSDLLVHGMINE